MGDESQRKEEENEENLSHALVFWLLKIMQLAVNSWRLAIAHERLRNVLLVSEIRPAAYSLFCHGEERGIFILTQRDPQLGYLIGSPSNPVILRRSPLDRTALVLFLDTENEGSILTINRSVDSEIPKSPIKARDDKFPVVNWHSSNRDGVINYKPFWRRDLNWSKFLVLPAGLGIGLWFGG